MQTAMQPEENALPLVGTCTAAHMWLDTERPILKVCMDMKFANGMHITIEVSPSEMQLVQILRLLNPVADGVITAISPSHHDRIIEILSRLD